MLLPAVLACSVSPATVPLNSYVGVACPQAGPPCPSPLVCVAGTCQQAGSGSTGAASATSGGSSGAASSGSSSGATSGGSTSGSSGSSSGTTGSNGGSSTGGGTTSGNGSSSGSIALCPPPSGSDWPLACSAQTLILHSPDAIGDFAVVVVDGGYLFGIVGSPLQNLQGGSFGEVSYSEDGGWHGNASGNTPATGSVSLLPPFGAYPTTLLAGLYDPAGQTSSFDQIFCAQPFDGDGGAPFELVYDATGDAAEVDKIRLAAAADGTVGFVFDDDVHHLVGWGTGPAGGGCPTAVSAIPTAASLGIAGTSTPNDSAIAGLVAGQFAIAEVYLNSQGTDVLALFAEPSGTLLAAPLSFGFAADPHVALASDGTNLTVLASDLGVGVLLYSVDGGTLQQMATLSAADGPWLAATSCGHDCTVVGWMEENAISGGNSFVPKYAVVNGQGCGRVQAFPAITAEGPAQVAVAAVPGNAIFACSLNTTSGTAELLGVDCSP